MTTDCGARGGIEHAELLEPLKAHTSEWLAALSGGLLGGNAGDGLTPTEQGTLRT
jgi:hypothetical protein